MSIKKLESNVIFSDFKEITALALVKQNMQIISCGTGAGKLIDFDYKERRKVRKESDKHKNAVVKIISFDKLVVSLSADLVYIYDYEK